MQYTKSLFVQKNKPPCGFVAICGVKRPKLKNCRMVDTDLAFEKSEVEAEVTTVVDSIKNPKSGIIKVPGVKEIIMDDPAAQARIILPRASRCA